MRIGVLILFLIATIAFGVTAGTRSGGPALDSAHESPTSAALYARHCTRCHGKDGKRSRSGARDLTDPAWQDRVSDERIFNVISNGKGHMPAFSQKMSESEIESLAQFVRGLRKR